jgi:mannose-6-phosphate isomerase-like protein (cupin superfamily)
MMATIPAADASAAIDLLRRHFERRAGSDDELARELTRVLALLHEVDFVAQGVEGSSLPIGRIFGGASSSRQGLPADVRAAFLPLLPDLPWRYGYTPRPDLPGLENRMGWAELIGPLAPFRSDRVCLGLTAIGTHTRYPEHAHPAVEVYFVISGTARWTADGISHERPPGSYILHPANIVHAMETGDEPLLAAYTWSGDIVSPSIYSELPDAVG